jgi:hypothetical protein
MWNTMGHEGPPRQESREKAAFPAQIAGRSTAMVNHP